MSSRTVALTVSAGAATILILLGVAFAQDTNGESRSASSNSSAREEVTQSASPTLSASEDYPEVGVHFRPADAGVRPSITTEEAVEKYRTDGPVPGLEEHATLATRLVLLTHDSYGGDAPMGSDAPAPYSNVLSWDVSFSGYESVPAGGLNVNGSAKERGANTCTFHYLVDATTGAQLVSWEQCRPSS